MAADPYLHAWRFLAASYDLLAAFLAYAVRRTFGEEGHDDRHSPSIMLTPPRPWDRASYRIPRQLASLVLALLIGAWVLVSTAATFQLGRRLLALLVSAAGWT
jgi:hypothetical protein